MAGRMGQVGRTRRHAAAFVAVPAPAAEKPRGNRSTPRGSPAAGRMKTMTGALITRFDAQGPAGIATTLRDAPRNAPETPSTPHVGTSFSPRGRAPCARSSLNPRARLLEVRARGLSDDLGGYPAISRTATLASDAARHRDAAGPRHWRARRRVCHGGSASTAPPRINAVTVLPGVRGCVS